MPESDPSSSCCRMAVLQYRVERAEADLKDAQKARALVNIALGSGMFSLVLALWQAFGRK